MLGTSNYRCAGGGSTTSRRGALESLCITGAPTGTDAKPFYVLVRGEILDFFLTEEENELLCLYVII